MVKKIIQDIVPLSKNETVGRHIEKEKVHNVLTHTSAKKHAAIEEKEQVEDALPESLPPRENKKEKRMEQSPIFEKMKQRHEERESFSEEYCYDKKNRFGRRIKIGASVFGALALVFYLLYGFFFNSVMITAHLKHLDVVLEKKEFQAKPEKGDAVAFQIMSLSEEQTIKLTPTGEKKVTKKSSGKITVYNAYSSQAQILIKNTRFETPDGKIFRIDSQVLIPGLKKVGGKDIPGSLDVIVYANEAGPEYNIGPTDFTIPGFKGTPRFTKFYAHSKTSMTGGVNGVIKTVSDKDLKDAKESLIAVLKEKLIAAATAQKPDGSVLYENAMFFTFTDTVDDRTQIEEKDVPLTIKGTVDSVLFDETELSRHIAESNVSLNDQEKIKIGNIEKMDFAWKTQKGRAPEKTETLDFSLSGTANVVWEIDEKLLKDKLVGMKKSEFPRIMAQFLGVDKTIADFSPFWRSSFPKNPEKIYIKTIVN